MSTTKEQMELAQATTVDGIDRRLHPRFGVPRCHVYSDGERLHLLNLGRSGMAVESFGRCNFSRSEDHRFVLDDEVNSIELVGRVSWVASSWVEDGQIPGTGLVQKAGISFQQVITPYRVGLWRAIESWILPEEDRARELVPLAEYPAALSRPPAIMLQPRDGAVFQSRFVTVEGRLRDGNGAATTVTVNGTPARIAGDRFSVRVHLAHEVNYLYAWVDRWNTADSRCFLGKIYRRLESTPSQRGLENPASSAEVLSMPDLGSN